MISPRWVVTASADPNATRLIAAELRIPDALAAILVQRGLVEPGAAKAFLRPDLERLTDPHCWADMPIAVELIARAIGENRPILVHGDYDVDGQCASAMLTRILRSAGGTVFPFVPHRIRDGYDFGPAGLAEAQRLGANLIITCDCGTAAAAAVRAARAAGIDVIVTDHHLPGDELPPANAVLDPRRADCQSEDKNFCGTGVAFKLAQALVAVLELSPNLPLHFLDYVALATIADVVPLVGENRILVRYGLKKLADSRWVGLRALIETAGLAGKPLRGAHVGLILDEAIEIVEQTLQPSDAAIVLCSETWHPGVIGIVASRLVERYGRPTFLVGWEQAGTFGRGSGRSIPGFDLHGALHRVGTHLEKYGGHTMAAGFTIRRDKFDDFRVAFLAVAGGALTPDDLAPCQHVDLELPLGSVSADLERLIRHLEPCGAGNPAPVFGVRKARAVGARRVGTNHLRFTLDDGSGLLPAIGFRWADAVPDDWLTNPLDVAFRLERDDWQGRVTIQARVASLAASKERSACTTF